MVAPGPSTISLVVIQPSPFCNVNCRYCYLPDRTSHKLIEETTLARIYGRLFASAHLGETLSILWHAGEPLAVPVAFYERAFALLASMNPRRIAVRQLFQTNATLITQEWCDFFKAHSVHISVSIDGPEWVHDANRVTRNGKGTFQRAMRGVRLLQANGILFHNIGVLTNDALDHPDELWDFFLRSGMTRLAFNVEETSGANTCSSVRRADDVERVQAFFRRLRELRRAGGQNVRIREVDDMEAHICRATGEPQSALNLPLATLSFDCDGNISTFSPELVTQRHPKYGHFRFGNVHDCGIDDILANEHFRAVNADIQRGIAGCRATCPYFSVCGGGEPANKLGEAGSLDATETLHCRLTIQALCEVVLEGLEESLGMEATADAVPASQRNPDGLASRRSIPLEVVSAM